MNNHVCITVACVPQSAWDAYRALRLREVEQPALIDDELHSLAVGFAMSAFVAEFGSEVTQ